WMILFTHVVNLMVAPADSGSRASDDEPMLEVHQGERDAEAPAPVSGTLREILAKEGEPVQVGAEIAVVETGGDSKVTATPEAPAPAPKEEELLPTGGEVPAKPAEGRKVEKEQLLPTGGEVPAKPAEGPAPSEPHRYSPGVQMAASDLKVDLSQVT